MLRLFATVLGFVGLAASVTAQERGSVVRYGAGLGLRTRIKYRLSVVGEGRVVNSELREAFGSSFYGQQSVRSGAHFEGILGLSYVFN